MEYTLGTFRYGSMGEGSVGKYCNGLALSGWKVHTIIRVDHMTYEILFEREKK